MAETTLRMELARNRMTIKDLIDRTGLARETINSVIDGDYSNCKTVTLKAIEEALPGVRLVIRLETAGDNGPIKIG